MLKAVVTYLTVLFGGWGVVFVSGAGSVCAGEVASLSPQMRAVCRAPGSLDRAGAVLEEIAVLNPLPGGVYPSDFAAPLFFWKRGGYEDERWLVRVEVQEEVLCAAVEEPRWRPDAKQWRALRARGREKPVRLEFYTFSKDRAVAAAEREIHVSADAFAAQVMVQRIPLPFLHAQDHPELSKWLLADPTTQAPPRVVLSDMPHCGNCHTVSRDGSTLGMDIDLYKDKGGYLLTAVQEEIEAGPEDFITWSDYRPDAPRTSMGLFTKLSGDGRYAVTTVKEKSFFIPIDHKPFSQLFFPIRGHLAVYDRTTGTMQALPGADREDAVQTSPALSPDARTVVFARAALSEELLEEIGDRKFLPAAGRYIYELNELYPYRFDLWRMDFNAGQGGTPEPLPGASNNGASNYFPRFSPDGKWIVYCRAETGLVLQPGSRLWIVPAAGGESRMLECNTKLFNSWHSFTPNGRWLVFSAKEVSSFTQVYAAHLDEQGRASVPVLLHDLHDREAAYIIPEAVPRDTPIRSIRLKVPPPEESPG